jgi:sigma-B regulation protein RsbU (phosphoserine phosphatase)
MALTPLVVVSAFHQLSIRLARRRLAGSIQRTLDANARQGLLEILGNCDEVFQRESRLMDVLIGRQAREVELRLAQEPEDPTAAWAVETYGLDETLDELTPPESEWLGQGRAETGPHFQVSYRRQAQFVPDGVEADTLTTDLARLWDMTAIYHEIRRNGPAGTLWQYTSLETGLHLSYPWTDGLVHPPSYDPRERDWYLRVKAIGDAVRIGPLIDAVSGQTIITIAAPVRRPDGSFAGVTAIDRRIPDILANMRLPFRWSEGAERMLVAPDPQADPCEPKVTILLQCSYGDTHGDWRRRIELEQLRSEDADEMRRMAAEMLAGVPGVRMLEHEGRRCLWAYGRPTIRGVVPLLIVPYDRVIEMASSTSRSLLSQSRLWLEATGIVLLLVAVATAAIATVRARTLTQPIMDLTRASRQLAAGDYEARVSIVTGDELEQLGTVFNETGPKLKERERMKQSLELAGAIQRSLLPKNAPVLEHFDIAAECLYCDEAGGDYYDFIDVIDLGPGKIGIALGDVSGHGTGAALLMAAVRSSLRTNIRHRGADLTTLFREVNRDLVRDTGEDKFVTLFYGILDDADHSLTWASGGHDPALWRHADTGEIEELPNTGMLMGIFEDVAFEQADPVHLHSGDVAVIGTDGIWEARGPDGSLFGKERLYKILRETRGSAQETCAAIVAAVTGFCGPVPQQDDITLIVVQAL